MHRDLSRGTLSTLQRRQVVTFAGLITGGLIAIWPVRVLSQGDPTCGNPFVNHFGPFDYRSASQQDKKTVESVHFTPGVEALTTPGTTTYGMMAGDVGYTLRVFPNHHRALIAMEKLGERHKASVPPGDSISVECYFKRAVQFRPDDTVARGLYARYLAKWGRKEEAAAHLRTALSFAGDNPFSHYNIGLLFFELGDHEAALSQAHKAMALGFPRQDLKDKLRAAGKWQEPPG